MVTPISDQNIADNFVRLSVITQFAIHQHESSGELENLLKVGQSRKLALDIMSHRKFFELNIGRVYGTLRADIVVMTSQELSDMQKEYFRKGVSYAQGLCLNGKYNDY